MTNNVLCEEFAARLADLLERDVDETTRAELESHALSCGDCGSLLADVRKLRIDASSLPELAPTRDLWEGIAQRIDAPVIPLRGGDVGRSRQPTRWPRWASMAAAAAVLIALSSLLTFYLTNRRIVDDVRAKARVAAATDSSVSSRVQPTTVAANESDSVSRVPSEVTPLARAAGNGSPMHLVSREKPSAEQVYTGEIARLRAIVAQRRAQLDPITISVIERNLKVIDDAIAQCRLALAKDPASRFLMESLNNALETKVELLRTASMLPARS